ncbi:MAG TPA: glycosyl hydrolase 115 family protein [Edaphobacter sp.]|nr:glycosyl hydrolase 115 family protein [Edaphobacter sp.]
MKVSRIASALFFLTFATLAGLPAFSLGEAHHVTSTPEAGDFALAGKQSLARVYVDSADWPGVLLAAGSFSSDVAQVTGRTPEIVPSLGREDRDVVLIGTIGRSAIIDRLIARHKLDVSAVRGRWEMSVTQIITNPMPGVRKALVIAGADKRGTIFGIYDLSEQIGVSPWAWWADVPIPHKNELYVRAGTYIQPEPRVKYRGIFLNDEAPSLTGWTEEKFGGYNSKFYTHVFELLLRLKANFLWPAMWNSAFSADDPLNPKLADEYGIVMSTSHEEPMMRAEKEWTRGAHGPWDYTRNATAIDEFWRTGMERNKSYENVVTLGMRGDGDTPMSATTNIELLEKIVADQRQILHDVVNSDLSKVPQVWALYKEVQTYYEKGMRVPEDVTLLWSDDNWGNLRRLPTAEERKRPGGAGIYYHFDYVGGPRSYKWLNTYSITKVWEQMHLALEYGADRIWVVNVGDLKPMEFPIEFFLDLGRTPERWGKDNLQEFTELWAAREFGPDHADEIARIISEYTRYNARRKPELIEPGTFSDQIEADGLVDDYRDTVARAKAISAELPPAYRDAFFELVLYPAEASENVLEMNVLAGKNRLYATQGRSSTNDLADQVRSLFAKDAEFTRQYNTMNGGKWNHMMDQTHIGYFFWNEPPVNIMPAVSFIDPKPEASMGISIDERSSFGNILSMAPFDVFVQQTHFVDIFNSGSTPFHYTAEADKPWIVMSSSEGTIDKETRLSVSLDWNKVPHGRQSGSIVIKQQSGPSRTIRIDAFYPDTPTRDSLDGFVESNGIVSIEAEHFTGSKSLGAAAWQKLPNFGETLSAMSIFPVTAGSATTPSTCLDYKIYFFDAGEKNIESILAPTLDFVPGRGLRYSVAFDQQPPKIVDAWASNTQKDWETAVSDGVHKVNTPVTINQAGYHTLHFCMVDPGVVLEKIVISKIGAGEGKSRFQAAPVFYLGPRESFHRVNRP